MERVDQMALLALGAASDDPYRKELDGLFVGEAGAIATDGHILMRVGKNGSGVTPDVGAVLAKAQEAATFHRVAFDPAKMLRLCKMLVEMDGKSATKKKGALRSSPLRTVMRFEQNPLTAIVLETVLENGRQVDALLMPLRVGVE